MKSTTVPNHPKKLVDSLSRGFTLIELLVVIFIITLVSATLLLPNNPHSSREVISYAELLKAQLQIAQEQAELEQTILGLKQTGATYEFYYYDDTARTQWIPLKLNDSFWTTYTIPKTIKFQWYDSSDGNAPQIVILPSGEILNFKLEIKSTVIPLNILFESIGTEKLTIRTYKNNDSFHS